MSSSDKQQLAQLNQQAVKLYQEGCYEEAVGVADQAVDLARRYLGEQHPDFVTCLNNLAALYKKMGNYVAAEPLYRQALEIHRQALGEQHPDFAASLNSLTLLYAAMGNHAAAEPLYRQALEIRRQVLGEQHPDFAVSLNNLAALYTVMGNHTAAEPLYRQALEIKRQVVSEGHPDFAKSLNSLAYLYKTMGNYAAAEPLYQQALEIRRQALGEEHPHFAVSLINLAGLYRRMGNYAAAEPLYRQALEINRQAQGEGHPDFATSLNNLAGLYQAMGNYAAAEPLSRQALEIRRQVVSEGHPDFAKSLNSLAYLYKTMGNYAAAEPLYQQALEIRRQALGEEHPHFAVSLINLAALYMAMGSYVAAEPLYRQALEINRQALGEQHTHFAASLKNLAELYRVMDNYADAEPLFRQALEIYRQVLGEQHPHFATSLNSLAYLYKTMGNYAAAEPLYRQALEIRRQALGEQHPDFATSLNNLAVLCVATQREDEGLTLRKQAAAIDDHMIGQIFSIGSESQRMAYLKSIQVHYDIFLSLVFQYFPDSSEAIAAALELVLRRKAIGAEALAAQRDAVLGGQYPELEPKLHQFTALRMQIAQKTLAGPGQEGAQAHQQLLAEWNSLKERLEAELAQEIPEMNLEQDLRAVDLSVVAQALPGQSVLVEFVRFNVFNFKAVPARNESKWKPARYMAFIIPVAQPDNVRMIDLGEAKPIDRMIAALRSLITRETESRGSRDLGALPVEEVRAVSVNQGIELRRVLFDPLITALRGCKRLLLAPDGDLTRLPFEVLPTDEGRRLIDDYRISYLSTGRDVLRFAAESTIQPTEPLLIADPDFDLGGDGAASSAETTPPSGRQSRDLGRDERHFQRLPGTRLEGERIGKMLGAQPWLAGAALEARLKNHRSPRILHMATHGFFLEDQKQDLNQEFLDLGAVGGQEEMGLGRLTGAGLENPLLRSGLALAGANTWLTQGNPPVEAEDGILTAEDVTGLDLLATEMVVLSACETGLGEIRAGEGVFGLRRAFVLAGARTLVMSLWKVPDQETQELMEDFYRRVLDGQSRADALREAQLAIREKHPDPLYWGAFICQGDPSSLSGAALRVNPFTVDEQDR